MEVFLVGEREMNDAAFVRVHGHKGEGDAGRPYTLRCMSRHRSQFSLARGAKVFYVTDDALSLWKRATKGLIDKMLKGFQ